MELKELRAFTKVVELGSFTKAAEALHTSKARLSHLVSHLESRLDVQLLVRTTRSLSLTEVGEDVFARAINILKDVQDTEKVAQIFKSKPTGVLKLSCGVEFGMIAVSSWMQSYMQRYPEVKVEAHFSGKKIDIVKTGIDLAIRIGQPEDSTLSLRYLGELQYGLFAAASYLNSHGCPENPNALINHRLLAFSGGRHGRHWQLRTQAQPLERLTLKVQPWLTVNNSFAIADAACGGLGIAKLPLLVAAPRLADGRLVQVLTDWHIEPVPVHALFADWRKLTPKVKAFLDIAVASFKQDL